jgi:folylpolyglutamate synthase/dihydropteroate synthase
MGALASYVESARLPRPIHALLGVMADKDGAQMLRILEGCSDRIWITQPPGVQPGRSGAPGAWLPSSHPAEVEPDFERALSAASALAGTTVVTGSFYTVGAALARLPGFQPVG